MKVEIWSDFVSPLCYIAKRKFDLALRKFEQQAYVKVEFKSFLLHTKEEITATDYKELLMQTCNIPAGKIDEWIEQLIDQACELNLPLCLENFTRIDTFDAHRLVKFAAKMGKESEVIDQLFSHFFSLEDKRKNNINDKHILQAIGQRCGLAADQVNELLHAQTYRRAIELDVDDALEIGIENVPFFIFNEKYALVGNQPVEVFLEALEESWKEDAERLLRKNREQACQTTYCEGDDCEV